ncbi:MAG: hypothetical protein M3N57_08055, partial [Actinomycetota bacterium]|nr:hypothetical protein [Actinomycetota bacterium]
MGDRTVAHGDDDDRRDDAPATEPIETPTEATAPLSGDQVPHDEPPDRGGDQGPHTRDSDERAGVPDAADERPPGPPD